MRNLLLVLVLLVVPQLALSQGLTTSPPGVGGGKVLASFPFSTTGCLATGTGGVNITRATKGTVNANGDGYTLTECQNNEYRVSTDGLLVEPARTNYVLNATTHAKVAEATGALPTAACVGWHDGVGAMTIAAGSATVTGLACAAVAPGTLCTFTVTVAGTMAITTAAGVTRAQIECAGSYRTSFISTAGTAVARNADQISATVPAVPSKWCVAVTAKPEEGRAWSVPGGGSGSVLWKTGTSANPNQIIVGSPFIAAALELTTFDGATAQKTVTATYPSAGSHRVTACGVSGTLSLTLDGTLVSGAPAGAGSGLIPSPGTTMYLGRHDASAGYEFGGYLKSIKICSAKSAKECR